MTTEKDMEWIDVIWTEENEAHIAEHGLSRADVEYVIRNPVNAGQSRSSGRPFFIGYAPEDDRRIMVIYERIDRITVYPISAFPVED